MPTPEQAADKFAREWLEAKTIAVTNYVAVASTLAQKAIDKQAQLLANFTEAVNNGSWARGLGKYVANDKMGELYSNKLNSITEINDAEKQKIIDSVALKQHLSNLLDDVVALFKNAEAGDTTVPPGLSDVALNQMIMSGIVAFEGYFSTATQGQAVYNQIQSYMNSHYGFPIKA